MNAEAQQLRLQSCGENLCETLDRLHLLHVDLLEVLARKEEALVSVEMDALNAVRNEEEELLHSVVDQEKQRLLLTEEIGDLIGVQRPSTIRVTEMLDHLPGAVSERLDESRNRLKGVAQRLKDQNKKNRALIEHSLGHIQVFLSKLVNEEMLGAQYGSDGHETTGDGGSMLMDRTG